MRQLCLSIVVCAVLATVARPAQAYSVLTHEAIVDSAWDDSIRPILLRRFNPSPDALRKARAFAYGGCIIQDMGYYPLSSRTFGDLTHYVRSGDFVVALMREAKDVNELAFALGALAHYVADNYGHPIGINRSVPILFPKVREKYGPLVTYGDDPKSHLRAEFSFDVVQVAKGAYLPTAYHDFIGFQVSKPLLERAFLGTYGLEIDDVFSNFDVAVSTFRWSVGTLLPALTKAAWAAKEEQLAQRDAPAGPTELFTYTRQEFEETWGTSDRRPNIGHRFLSMVLRIVPRIGPRDTFAIKAPSAEAERHFLQSLQVVMTQYRRRLADVSRGRLELPDRNFDTGEPIRAGEYRLVDEAFADLLGRLGERHFVGVPEALRATLLDFYRTPATAATEPKPRERQKLAKLLDEFRQRPSASR